MGLPALADLVLSFCLEIAGIMALVQLLFRRPAGAVNHSPARFLRAAEQRGGEWLIQGNYNHRKWDHLLEKSYLERRSASPALDAVVYVLTEKGSATEQAAERLSIDREWVLRKLKENVTRALQERPVLDSSGKPTGEYRYNGPTVNRALELIGKEVRMFVDRKEVGQPGEFAELENMSADELRAYIMQALGEDANKNETLN